ncbi:GlsB/YeaQ/YmgE family stress response membrane protein [Tabrizicola sp. J26]|uniref:GlsB/YeaQ/YmgE family stress response membrane protein n=1 Tax=Alitabrizicola rongguiensis TaxID=2909234 RepID=UPI001F17417A|nr:GlsB/YeaQ/YmgE family stress response membrane protein [Tabrizicola rongguiensis]MCF1707355.1 GlsB/YeaQ/YmgE family stress response membrane protein [Tabrizicola rongguiensis]
MGVESVFAMLIVGAIAGWLAGKIVAGYGFGVIGNIVVGIVGALVAGFVLPRLGFGGPGGVFSSIIHSTIGAVIFLALVRLVKKV